jgi:hypothetical protein
MADLLVAKELQAYLVAQGVGQLPSATPSLTVPMITLQPRDGAPLPRRASKTAGSAFIESATITIRDPLLSSPSSLEEWMEEAFIDIIVRALQGPLCQLIHRQIRGLIVPYDSSGGRKQWMMNNLLVEMSDQWRSEQDLPQLRAVGATDAHVTYDRIASYRFACRRKILAGLSIP